MGLLLLGLLGLVLLRLDAVDAELLLDGLDNPGGLGVIFEPIPAVFLHYLEDEEDPAKTAGEVVPGRFDQVVTFFLSPMTSSTFSWISW